MTELRAIPREFREVPIGLIDPPALASRSTMDERGLDELTANIRAHGVISPLSLARAGDRYEIIAGHRRFLASGRAGLVAVPAVVYPSTDAALEAIKYAENRHREELNAAEEAIWFAELLERDAGGDVDRLCDLLKEKRPYVEGRLLLFQGDPRVFQALQDGKISIGVAHQLNRVSDELQRRSFLHSAIVGGATIAVVSGWVQEWQRMQSSIVEARGDAPAIAPSTPTPVTEYFKCYVCGGTHNVHTMQPLNVHGSCREAILDPMLGRTPGAGEDPHAPNDARRI